MSLAILAIVFSVLMLAAANGANDVAKGVATLLGSGIAKARLAIIWGTAWTAVGGIVAAFWGTALLNNFVNGFLAVDFPMTLSFVISVIVGACLWVALATRFGLPVSTTHALLGGIVGAALVTSGWPGLQLTAILQKAVLPLLLSPILAIVFCFAILLVSAWLRRQIPAWQPGCCSKSDWRSDPFVCTEASPRQLVMRRLWLALHWLSSGATSFARGLNDVPKIAAFLVLATSLSAQSVEYFDSSLTAIILVTLAMAIGGLWGGFRVLKVLAHRITAMDASQGLTANVGTAGVVLLASQFGLPVSTTHVSTGALMGIRWAGRTLPKQTDALLAIMLAWLVTLPVAAIFAAGMMRVSQLI